MSLAHTFKYGLKGGVMAAILNLIIFEIALRGFGVDFTVVMGGVERTVTEIQVVIASIVPGLVAVPLYLWLARKTARPDYTFRILAAIVLVLSLYAPYSAATHGATAAALGLLHVVAAFEITKSLTHDARLRVG